MTGDVSLGIALFSDVTRPRQIVLSSRAIPSNYLKRVMSQRWTSLEIAVLSAAGGQITVKGVGALQGG